MRQKLKSYDFSYDIETPLNPFESDNAASWTGSETRPTEDCTYQATSMQLVHPAVPLLLRMQAQARVRRLASRLLTPRRLVLTCLAGLLAVFWLGNAAMAVAFRDALDPAYMRRGIPLALFAYSCWHLLKLVYQRPEAGIEWTPAEQEWLAAAPLKRSDLVLYRLLVSVASGMLKAAVFTLFMLPDLSLPLAGFWGMLLALILLDLLRMCFEMIAWGVPDRWYQALRAGIVAAVAAVAGVGLVAAMRSPSVDADLASPGSFQFATGALEATAALGDTTLGQIVLAPFQVFSHVMLAEQLDLALAGWIALALAVVFGAGCATVLIDAYFLRLVDRRRRREYPQLKREIENSARPTVDLKLQRVICWFGGGAIFWRQLLGARRYASSLLLVMALPAVMAWLPAWLTEREPQQTLWNVTGALAFYTFLLLPTALKFDFQRDIDRMPLIKSLPIRPLAVVLGQLATPVLLASLLQLIVIAATVLFQGVAPPLALLAWSLLTTLNVIIFGLDNLMFLWFPHRLKQEGLLIFLRTTLVFTAKGLLFAVAVGLVFLWAMATTWFAHVSGLPGSPIFFAGLWGIAAAALATLLRLLVLAYDRYDPQLDGPV